MGKALICYWKSGLIFVELFFSRANLKFFITIFFLNFFSGFFFSVTYLLCFPYQQSLPSFLLFPYLLPDIIISYLLSAERWVRNWKPQSKISTELRGISSWLVWRFLGTAQARGSVRPPSTITSKALGKSRVLKGSPELLHTWSPSSLLYQNSCCSFSRFYYDHLHLTTFPGLEVILVIGLGNMQQIILTGSAERKPGFHLASFTRFSNFLSEVWSILLFLVLPH